VLDRPNANDSIDLHISYPGKFREVSVVTRYAWMKSAVVNKTPLFWLVGIPIFDRYYFHALLRQVNEQR
jgi:hypothetical protein